MSLQVWLPLINDLNNYGINALKTASVQSGCAQAADGKIGKCWKNTGSNATVATPLTFESNQFTLAAWVRIDTISKNWGNSFGLEGNGNFIRLGTEHSNGTSYGFNFYKTIDGTDTKVFDAYPCTIQDNVWVHYAMSYDGTKYYMYENGVLVRSATADKTGIIANPTNLYLFGGRYNYYVKQSLNDVRVYDHVLSIKEIRELSKALVIHYAMDNNGYGMANYFLNSNFATGTTANWGGVNSSSISIVTKDERKCVTGTKGTSNYLVRQSISGYSYTANSQINFTISADVYVEETGTITIGNWISTTQASGWQGMSFSETWHTSNSLKVGWNHVSVTHVNAKNQYNGSIITAFAYSGTTFWMTNIKFEFGDIDTPWIPNSADSSYTIFNINSNKEIDTSGYGYHGSKNGTINPSSNTPRYSVASVLNGDTNCIQFPFISALGGNTDFTLSVWCYKTVLGSKGYQTIFGGPSGFELEARDASNDTHKFILWNWGKGSYEYEYNKWYLVTFVRTASDTKLYINGEVKTTGTTGTTPSGNYFIGAWAEYNKQNFDGMMSDFRMYNTALSADDIMLLYQSNGEIDTNGRIYSGDFTEV